MNQERELQDKIHDYIEKILEKYLLQKLKENDYQVKQDNPDFDLKVDIFRSTESSYGDNFKIDLNSDEHNCTIKGKGEVNFYELNSNGFRSKKKEFNFDSLKLDFKNFTTPEFRVIQTPNIYLD